VTETAQERWTEEVADLLRRRYGRAVESMSPIELGWLNVKWKVVTDEGPLFVKVYHPDRYRLHERPDRRRAIAETLRLQRGLHAAGVACPSVYEYEGQLLQSSESGLLFTVQDWTEGVAVRAGEMSAAQMYELGAAAGRMHAWLREAAPPPGEPGWKPDRDAYLLEWSRNRDQAQAEKDDIVLGWLSRSRTVAEAIDVRMFDESPVGWLHWDLWVDNLLVRGDRLAGIVDFDRMTVAYPEIDVARAVLSGALADGNLRTDAAKAFMEGYRERVEAPRGTLARAAKMVYLIESVWWYRTEVRRDSELRGLLGRFLEEMHWIEDHWNELPEMLDEM
jgi:homoserine kinase type II